MNCWAGRLTCGPFLHLKSIKYFLTVVRSRNFTEFQFRLRYIEIFGWFDTSGFGSLGHLLSEYRPYLSVNVVKIHVRIVSFIYLTRSWHSFSFVPDTPWFASGSDFGPGSDKTTSATSLVGTVRKFYLLSDYGLTKKILKYRSN